MLNLICRNSRKRVANEYSCLDYQTETFIRISYRFIDLTQNKSNPRLHPIKISSISAQYGITGCGVFKGGIQNQKGFWLKINCIQMKLPNFENWSNGRCQKVPKFDFQSQFSMSKIIGIFLIFFFIEEYQLRSTFVVIDIF